MLFNLVTKQIKQFTKTSFIKRRNVVRNGIFVLAGTSGVAIVQPFVLEKATFDSYIWATIRFLRSLKTGVTISLDYYFSMLGLDESSSNYKYMMSVIHQRAADRILNTCLESGGTYIKLGQGLVTLSHILPIEYIKTLKQLQDKCLFSGPKDMRIMMREDFDASPEQLFKFIEEEPIAAASLAQVFRGVTHDGEEVAIKVQYKDLQSRFRSDVATISFLLKIIGFIHRDFNFGWVLNDLSDRLKQELDFINEGKNAERCADDLKRFKYVYVPKVRWDLTSSRILVTEFIHGIKVNEVEELKKQKFPLKIIDLQLIEAFGYQIFQTGFVHADPHPGNVLIRKINNKPQLVLLDHGLYQFVDDKTRTSLSRMWKSIILQDFKAMEKYAEELQVKDAETFAQILTQRPLRKGNLVLSVRISRDQMEEMTKNARERFDKIMDVLRIMPRSLLLVVRNLNIVRSIIHDHGDPVDRYVLLARCAVAKGFEEQGKLSMITNVPRRIWFELNLFTSKVWFAFIKVFLKLLIIIGKSPETKKLMAEIS